MTFLYMFLPTVFVEKWNHKILMHVISRKIRRFPRECKKSASCFNKSSLFPGQTILFIVHMEIIPFIFKIDMEKLPVSTPRRIFQSSPLTGPHSHQHQASIAASAWRENGTSSPRPGNFINLCVYSVYIYLHYIYIYIDIYIYLFIHYIYIHWYIYIPHIYIYRYIYIYIMINVYIDTYIYNDKCI